MLLAGISPMDIIQHCREKKTQLLITVHNEFHVAN